MTNGGPVCDGALQPHYHPPPHPHWHARSGMHSHGTSGTGTAGVVSVAVAGVVSAAVAAGGGGLGRAYPSSTQVHANRFCSPRSHRLSHSSVPEFDQRPPPSQQAVPELGPLVHAHALAPHTGLVGRHQPAQRHRPQLYGPGLQPQTADCADPSGSRPFPQPQPSMYPCPYSHTSYYPDPAAAAADRAQEGAQAQGGAQAQEPQRQVHMVQRQEHVALRQEHVVQRQARAGMAGRRGG